LYPPMTDKNVGNVIGGYKAALHNPNVSVEGKEHAQKALEELNEGTTTTTSTGGLIDGKDAEHVLAGHKANIANPTTSEESKQHSMRILEAYIGVEGVDGKKISNIVAGHKAALHNPNVSAEAKEHSRKVLQELEK